MSNQFRLVFDKSPFLPIFDHDGLVANVIRDMEKLEPSAAIALSTTYLMQFNLILLRLEPKILETYQVSEKDLYYLNLGYAYPLQTLLASAVCKKVPDDMPDVRMDVYEQLLMPTRDFEMLRVQDQIGQDLRATINLIRLDPSGALVFQYLKDYPFSQDELFQNGMEIATIVYFGIAQMVVKATGDDSWLTKPYDPHKPLDLS